MHNDIFKTQSSPECFGQVWLIECIKHEITVRLLARSTIDMQFLGQLLTFMCCSWLMEAILQSPN